MPPKNEVQTVKEDDAFYTKRCKLYYKKGDSWADRGVGNLHLKKADDKCILLIRADTNLGKRHYYLHKGGIKCITVRQFVHLFVIRVTQMLLVGSS